MPYDGEAATPPERKRKEATDAYSVYEEIIKDNIEYDHFVRYGQVDKDRLDEIVSIILETVCSKRKTIRIAGDDYPAELVKAKFMKLNSSHIEFVFDCMKENTTKIRNIKQYLILNLPYLLFVYLFDKIGAAIRLTPGADASEKLLQLGTGFAAAFSSIAPSLHPADLLIGVAGAVIIRLAVYMKGKNAKKYRKGMEYGSARWSA